MRLLPLFLSLCLAASASAAGISLLQVASEDDSYSRDVSLEAVQWLPQSFLSAAAGETPVKAHEIFMPALSSTMKEGKIVAWNKKIGERVEVGDVVMVVESDKADMDVESFAEGWMAVQHRKEGEMALVGETVALLAESPEEVALVQGGNGVEIPSGDANRHDGTTAWKVNTPEDTAVHTESAPAAPAPPVPSTFLSPAELAKMPQAKEIFMPALSSTMTEGKVSRWLKKEGDFVAVGDVVMVVESDKADMDVESFEEGYLAQILVKEGQTAMVGQTCALVAEKQGDLELLKQAGTQAIAPGSDKRHDGTTAVFDRSTPVDAAPQPAAVSDDAPAVSGGVSLEGLKTAEIFMPALSSTMTEGKVSAWQKKLGDKVNVGDVVMVVESDKADMDVESFEEGYLAHIAVKEGQTAKVGAAVAFLVADPADVDKLQTALKAGPAPPAAPKAAAAQPSPAQSAAQQSAKAAAPAVSGAAVASGKFGNWVAPALDTEVADRIPPGMSAKDVADKFMHSMRSSPEGLMLLQELESTARGKQQLEAMTERSTVRIPQLNALMPEEPARQGSLWQLSPYARSLAEKLGVDISTVQGSGPGGRVFAEDVMRAAEAKGKPQKEHWGKEEYRQQQGAAKTAAPAAAASTGGAKWVPQEGVVAATPMARRIAKEKNVNLQLVKGTGSLGRVTENDVKRHLGLPVDEPKAAPPKQQEAPAAAAAPAEKKSEKKAEASGKPSFLNTPVSIPPKGTVALDGLQKAVAKNMAATLDVPIFRVTRAIQTDRLDELAAQLKARGVTASVLLAKAVALALERHPLLNAAYDSANGGVVKHPGKINIAMAVATEGGLITPVLQDANSRGVADLSKNWKELVQKAREKRLAANEYSSGTFYISNLGMYGVTEFDAILPAGAGSILAVGASKPVVSLLSNGQVGVKREMHVTITCDHRHIYGAHAAEFLRDLADIIENHTAILLV